MVNNQDINSYGDVAGILTQKKKTPRSIQQQGLLRQRQAHRPCVQLSGESAGLPQPQLGTKIPHQSVSLEASGVFRFELIWCYDR